MPVQLTVPAITKAMKAVVLNGRRDLPTLVVLDFNSNSHRTVSRLGFWLVGIERGG